MYKIKLLYKKDASKTDNIGNKTYLLQLTKILLGAAHCIIHQFFMLVTTLFYEIKIILCLFIYVY